MSDYHLVLSMIGSVVGVTSYVPYITDILRGRTKPHPFSWFVWTILTGTIFVAQEVTGGGAGSLVSGITFLACIVITVLALIRGEKEITRLDWYCLASSLAGIILWFLTSQALVAVVIVTITDLIMYIPTVCKSYWKPYEETLSMWVLNTIKWLFGFVSLQTITVTTALFPAAMVLANVPFIAMLIIRRRQMSSVSHGEL